MSNWQQATEGNLVVGELYHVWLHENSGASKYMGAFIFSSFLKWGEYINSKDVQVRFKNTQWSWPIGCIKIQPAQKPPALEGE